MSGIGWRLLCTGGGRGTGLVAGRSGRGGDDLGGCERERINDIKEYGCTVIRVVKYTLPFDGLTKYTSGLGI